MISLANVTKDYHLDGATKITPIRNVNLEIRQGEFLMIVGRSGTGKTTLLNLCAGLIRPTSGQVSINGTDIQSLTDKQVSALRSKNIGFIFQFQSMLPNLTVIENVAMPAAACSNVKGNPLKRAAELLEMVGLGERTTVYPRQLSAGELRRAAIARALMNRPETLLADEPTADLDMQTEFKIISLLQQIHKSGITIMMITHNLNLVRYATRALRVENGELKPVSAEEFQGQRTGSGSEPLFEPSSNPVPSSASSIPTVLQSRQSSNSRAIWSNFKPRTIRLALFGVAVGAFVLGLSVQGIISPQGAQTLTAKPAAEIQRSQPALVSDNSGNLGILRQYDSLAVKLNGLMTFEFFGNPQDSQVDLKIPASPITWSGASFSGAAKIDDIRDEISGKLSPDGTSLLSLVYSRTITQGAPGNGVYYRVALQDLPLVVTGDGQSSTMEAFKGAGVDLQKYIANVDYREGALGSDQIASTILKSVDWGDPATKAALKITFAKLADLAKTGKASSMGMD